MDENPELIESIALVMSCTCGYNSVSQPSHCGNLSQKCDIHKNILPINGNYGHTTVFPRIERLEPTSVKHCSSENESFVLSLRDLPVMRAEGGRQERNSIYTGPRGKTR